MFVDGDQVVPEGLTLEDYPVEDYPVEDYQVEDYPVLDYPDQLDYEGEDEEMEEDVPGDG